VSQGDTVNGALARGWNYQALGNARDAWCLVNRHYSARCNDKCTGEFSNKVHQILYKLYLLTLHFYWKFHPKLRREEVVEFTSSLIVGSFCFLSFHNE
jgi:hypothetical protein